MEIEQFHMMIIITVELRGNKILSLFVLSSPVTGLFFLVLLLNQQRSPPLRLQSTHQFPLRLDYGRSSHEYVNQRLQIQLELLMTSGMPLETCWAFNERWNNKFCYKVASCWLFLLSHTDSHCSTFRIVFDVPSDVAHYYYYCYYYYYYYYFMNIVYSSHSS